MPVGTDIIGASILCAAFLLLLAGAEVWARAGNPKPEWTRKLVHLGGGIVCLFFPFLIQSVTVIIAMCLTLTAIFAIGAKTGTLRSLHLVKRRSRGAEYYPLAIIVLFMMSSREPWFYVASILVLAVADTCAALVGSSYGRVRYEVDDSTKSIEGSLSFLLMAIIVILAPLLIMTDIPFTRCILASLLVGLLVTGFEAVSLHGADNLFVPIGACAILTRITTKPVPEIVFQLCSLAFLFVLIAFFGRRTKTFNTGGTIMFVLFTYGTWSLGSPHWTLPVLIAFVLYSVMWMMVSPSEGHIIRVRVRILFRALAIPLVLLVTANATHSSARFYAPFVAAWATVTAFAMARHLVFSGRSGGLFSVSIAAGTLTSLTVIAGSWAIVGTAQWPLIVFLSVVVIVITMIRVPFLRESDVANEEHFWTASEMGMTALAALLVFYAQGMQIFGLWQPAAFSFPGGFQ